MGCWIVPTWASISIMGNRGETRGRVKNARLAVMQIRTAARADVPSLASLVWRFDGHNDTDPAGLRGFTTELDRWWDGLRDTHLAFLATQPSGSATGMAWLALTARVPRPCNMTRTCGDVERLRRARAPWRRCWISLGSSGAAVRRRRAP